MRYSRGEALRYLSRALLWQIPWLVGGVVLILSTVFIGFPIALLGITPLAGIGASVSALFVSLAPDVPRSGRPWLLALALVPVLVSVGILVAMSPMLEVAAAVLLFSVILISGAPTLYVVAVLAWRGGVGAAEDPLES